MAAAATSRRLLPRALGVLALLAVVGSWSAAPVGDGPDARSPDNLRHRARELALRATTGAPSDGCIRCHAGIEEMHPGYPLSCVDCHGGDGNAATKEAAHVLPKVPPPGDERVLPENHDLAWQRFVNPSNLRVAETVCGDCHDSEVHDVRKSLHGTTAGHLSDGYYENGLSRSKRTGWSVFAERDEDGTVPPGALGSTQQVPGMGTSGSRSAIETHYSDLPRKACMHCHLWGEGRAVRGRVGLDGDYRGEGCAACHVTYADDGRSRSADPTVDKLEPGHPIAHRMTSAIPTQTCTRCHYGDASIGLSFRGMAQLMPGMPAGPDVPGTTATLLNGTYYVQDKDMTPPDVHHQRGMHCIDCHGYVDTMGDGNIWPNMDHAVSIECTSCHGTIDRVSDMTDSRGNRVSNLEREGDNWFLRSKVTGARHPVVQAKHVVDPKRPEYNPRAAEAMTGDHGRLECYACHSGWNVNFFGFHFDRNEQFTQLDLISGRRTPGRVTTQEKVFGTFSQFRLGFNHEGMVAPYMVGFSTIGSFHDDKGNTLLRQGLPVTAAGLSGVSLIPHQTHTTRPEARSCVECHRSPTTWGLGGSSHRLTREFAWAVDRRALHTIAVDGRQLARTLPVADLELPAAGRALALRVDPVQARATHAYVGLEDGALATVDLRNPVAPKLLAQERVLSDPRRMVAQGDWLFVADGPGGVSVLDLTQPAAPKLVATLPTTEARAIAVAWPWLLVADGPGGLLVCDIADPRNPSVLSSVDLNEERSVPKDATDVAVLFQHSRTKAADELGERIERSPARHLAFVAAGLDGAAIVDFTEPSRPVLLQGQPQRAAFTGNRNDVRGVAVSSQFDIGSAGGGIRSQERDYLYLVEDYGNDDNRQRRVRAVDVTDPLRPRTVEGGPRVGTGTGQLRMVRAYNQPFLQHFVVAVGAGGSGTVLDASRMATGLRDAAVWADLPGVADLAFEEFVFDRLLDERGRWEKDISHEDCRYLTRDEILKVLRTPLDKDSATRGRGPTTPGGRK